MIATLEPRKRSALLKRDPAGCTLTGASRPSLPRGEKVPSSSQPRGGRALLHRRPGPKARPMSAQGNALGNHHNPNLALKGRANRGCGFLCRPFRAGIVSRGNPGRRPGLAWQRTFGAEPRLSSERSDGYGIVKERRSRRSPGRESSFSLREKVRMRVRRMIATLEPRKHSGLLQGGASAAIRYRFRAPSFACASSPSGPAFCRRGLHFAKSRR